MTLYGIKNCDTVKKARKWLEANAHQIAFHDFRDQGLSADALQAWVDKVGWETLLNKRSTSFRALEESDKTDLNAQKATALMLANPTLIKRPVLEVGDKVLVGFKDAEYAAVFNS